MVTGHNHLESPGNSLRESLFLKKERERETPGGAQEEKRWGLKAWVIAQRHRYLSIKPLGPEFH